MRAWEQQQIAEERRWEEDGRGKMNGENGNEAEWTSSSHSRVRKVTRHTGDIVERGRVAYKQVLTLNLRETAFDRIIDPDSNYENVKDAILNNEGYGGSQAVKVLAKESPSSMRSAKFREQMDH